MDCWEVAEKKLPGETEMEAEVRCNARWKVRLEEWNEEASEKQDNDPKYQARKIVEAAVEAEREGEKLLVWEKIKDRFIPLWEELVKELDDDERFWAQQAAEDYMTKRWINKG
jgi:hypothetical protein